MFIPIGNYDDITHFGVEMSTRDSSKFKYVEIKDGKVIKKDFSH